MHSVDQVLKTPKWKGGFSDRDMLPEDWVFLVAQREEVKPRSNFAALQFLSPVNIEADYYSKKWILSL